MSRNAVLGLVMALAVAGCASGGPRPEPGDAAVQFIEIENATPDRLFITARVGTSPEQELGFLEPSFRRTYRVATGASTTGDIFLRARDPNTGMEATTTLKVTPGQTLQWVIRY